MSKLDSFDSKPSACAHLIVSVVTMLRDFEARWYNASQTERRQRPKIFSLYRRYSNHEGKTVDYRVNKMKIYRASGDSCIFLLQLASYRDYSYCKMPLK